MLDPRRFGRLAAVHWAEQGHGMLWFLAIGIGVHVCAWLLVTEGGTEAWRYDAQVQGVLCIAGYVITALLFAARYHAGLAGRESATTLLMRPASTFEKGLLALLVIAVAYPLAYIAAVQVVNLPAAWLGDAVRDARALQETDAVVRKAMQDTDFGPFLPFSGDDAVPAYVNLLLAVTSLQALVAAGMLYFHKLSWLKTLVALFVLVVLALPLLAALTGADPDRILLDGFARRPPVLLAWSWILWCGTPLLLWSGNFFLLREREMH